MLIHLINLRWSLISQLNHATYIHIVLETIILVNSDRNYLNFDYLVIKSVQFEVVQYYNLYYIIYIYIYIYIYKLRACNAW